MFSKWFPKKRKQELTSSLINKPIKQDLTFCSSPLAFNWIKTGKLAIGAMPKSIQHWQQLEADNFSQRFSCCYPYEHIFTPIPSHWISKEISLPDHRAQDILRADTLIRALQVANSMMNEASGPLYIHCFAGQERSVLVAIGLICILDKKDLFDSLNYVRSCHKKARPIYSQLDLLDQLLKDKDWYS
jgi:protein-tyrosine phosphatase